MAIFDRFRGRNRISDIDEARRLAEIENEARRRDTEERRERDIQEKTSELSQASANQNRFNVNVIANLVPRSRGGWLFVLIIFLLLIISYATDFLGFKTGLRAYGVTIIGLITIITILIFILYGWFTCFSFGNEDIAKFYVATALFIWVLDLIPQNFFLIGTWLGPEWAGFEWIPFKDTWQISIFSVLLSGTFFSLLYVNMIFNIIEKEYLSIALVFLFILVTNHFFNFLANYLPFLSYNFSIPYPKLSFILVLALIGIFGLVAWKLDKNKRSAVPEFFSSLYLIFVFSFFWINNGWQGNVRAWFHWVYILAFGFGYIKLKEKKPAAWRIYIASLLLFDFFGYGLLWSSDYLVLKFVPPTVLFVVGYCYYQESNEVSGKKKITYPVFAFILLITFILIMSINVAGLEQGGTIPFIARQGTSFSDIYKQFTDNLKGIVENRLDIATGGLYRSSVEKSQFEPLGVFFDKVRAAQPRFYTDEDVTLWGTIKSRTLSDPVSVNFTCFRWKDGKRIEADKNNNDIKLKDIVIPDSFTVYTLEDKDVECTFKQDARNRKLDAGTNTITLSATYNFLTSAYKKNYFIDKGRQQAMTRENLDPLKEFGISDRTPDTKFTNGPVDIAIDLQPLVPVSDGTDFSPALGILLKNRDKITDKNGKAVGEWQGKIKKINELAVVLPKGLTLNGASCKPVEFKPIENPEDFCSNSCSGIINKPCEKRCFAEQSDEGTQQVCWQSCLKENDISAATKKCNDDCSSIFKADSEGEANYAGYYLNIDELEKKTRDEYKDIDKFRTFVCRITPTKDVLENVPITTKFIRARAKYDYLLEKSYNVVVVQAPSLEEKKAPEFDITIPDKKYAQIFFSSTNENERLYSPIVFQAAKKYNVDYLFAKSIIQTENDKWSPAAFRSESGKVGSSGLMQILSETAQGLGCSSDWSTSVESNIDCGVKYIRYLIDLQEKRVLAPDLRNIAAAYNCGEQAMKPDTTYGLFWKNPDNCWSTDRKTNTRIYVDKVMSAYSTLGNQLNINYIPGAETQITSITNPFVQYIAVTNEVLIRWDAVQNSNAKKYLITRYYQGNSQDSYETSATSYYDRNVLPGLEYSYLINAVDNDNNVYASVETPKIVIPKTS